MCSKMGSRVLIPSRTKVFRWKVWVFSFHHSSYLKSQHNCSYRAKNLVTNQDNAPLTSTQQEETECNLSSTATSRRKSTSPCWRAPIDRSSRESLKSSIKLQRHRLFSDHDERQDQSNPSSADNATEPVDLDLSQDQLKRRHYYFFATFMCSNLRHFLILIENSALMTSKWQPFAY